MTPVYFEQRFGWLHAAPDAASGPGAGGVGVVLCPAFGQEEVCTHHGLMALADLLAAEGMPTIRFDYRGTGDSVSADVTLERMIDDAERAAACLRQSCGVGTVVLAGTRLGAAVALRASEAIEGVGALVLLAPALSGQAFLRETRASASIASLSGLDPVPAVDSGLPLNANGFHWSGRLQGEIAALDLTAMAAPGVPVLMLAARGDRRPGRLAATWREAGTAVSELAFPDYDGWMQDPTTNATPVATFASIGAWLGEQAVVAAPVTSTHLRVASDLIDDDYIETPMRFGAGDAVFGILCAPRHRDAEPVVALLLHEGSTHHIGNGGAYVVLARLLAEAGVASLRMDLTGMGDSPAGDNPRHPHYDPERIAESVAALDRLQALGFAGAMTFGLCSGAHTALQVTLADPRVLGTMILNLQKFIWHYGDDIRVAARDNKRSLKGYLRAMRNPGEWKRALAGEADLKGIARVLAKRARGRIVHAVRSLVPPAPGSETARVRAQMQELARRRVHAHFVFSDEDPGLAEMGMQFGRKARRLAAYAPARMVVLDEADHHFNGTTARRRFYDLAIAAVTGTIAAHAADAPRVALPRPETRAPGTERRAQAAA